MDLPDGGEVCHLPVAPHRAQERPSRWNVPAGGGAHLGCTSDRGSRRHIDARCFPPSSWWGRLPRGMHPAVLLGEGTRQACGNANARGPDDPAPPYIRSRDPSSCRSVAVAMTTPGTMSSSSCDRDRLGRAVEHDRRVPMATPDAVCPGDLITGPAGARHARQPERQDAPAAAGAPTVPLQGAPRSPAGCRRGAAHAPPPR
jgi:hypothetical protein